MKQLFDKRLKDITIDNVLGLSKSNIEVLNDFFDLVKSEGLTYGRRYKHLVQITKVLQSLDKDFLSLTKDDLIRLAGKIKDNEEHSASTKSDYLGAIKKLYKTLSTHPKYETDLDLMYLWLYDKRNKFFSTSIDRRRYKSKKELLDEEEVMQIIEKANNIRDKVVFSLLATQGIRPGELMSIRRQDITKKEDEMIIEVVGKTGPRPLYVEESYVINYIEEYLKTLPDSLEHIFKITQKRLGDVLKEICYDLKINKKAHLYQFRHFAITRDRIKGLSPGAMEQKFGWVKGSKRVATYDKSTGIDYRREIREKAGKEVQSIRLSRFETVMSTKTQMQEDIEELKTQIKEYAALIESLYKKFELKI